MRKPVEAEHSPHLDSNPHSRLRIALAVFFKASWSTLFDRPYDGKFSTENERRPVSFLYSNFKLKSI
jgi:hypothetical protein